MADRKEMSARFLPGQLDTRSDIALCLGHFVSRWSLAETCLIMPMLLATNSSQEVCSAILAATNSAEGKINTSRMAVANSPRLADDARKPGILKALSKFMSLCPTRNSYMHHTWGVIYGEAYTLNYRVAEDHADRKTLRTCESIIQSANEAVQISFELCRSTQSQFITQEAANALKLEVVAAPASEPGEEHMSEAHDAMVDLKQSIDKQNELQEETNALLRGLIDTLQHSGQATADLTEWLRKQGPTVPPSTT